MAKNRQTIQVKQKEQARQRPKTDRYSNIGTKAVKHSRQGMIDSLADILGG